MLLVGSFQQSINISFNSSFTAGPIEAAVLLNNGIYLLWYCSYLKGSKTAVNILMNNLAEVNIQTMNTLMSDFNCSNNLMIKRSDLDYFEHVCKWTPKGSKIKYAFGHQRSK